MTGDGRGVDTGYFAGAKFRYDRIEAYDGRCVSGMTEKGIQFGGVCLFEEFVVFGETKWN